MRIVLCLPLVIGLACGSQKEDSAVPLLEELASAWSAGARPTCRPTRSGTGSSAHSCEWPWVVTPTDSGQLSGELMSPDRYLFINWNRRFVDSTSGLHLRDSLSRALVARGLQERECKYRGRRWESSGLGVEFILDSVPNGRWVASIMATGHPDAMPTLFCPAQPRVPTTAT